MCSATHSLHAVEKSLKKILKKCCSKLLFGIRILQTHLINNNVSSAVVHSEDTEILELTQLRYLRLHSNYKKTFIFFGLVFSGHACDTVRNASFTSV
jgi:hypothetical protein